MRALQLASEELQPDAGGSELLGQRRELDTAAEPLVLVHDDRDRHAGRAHLAGEGGGLVKFGPGDGTGGDLLGEDPGDAGGPQRVDLGVEGLGPAGPARRADGGGAGGHRAVVRLDAQEVVVTHPRIVSWGCVIRPAVCNNP